MISAVTEDREIWVSIVHSFIDMEVMFIVIALPAEVRISGTRGEQKYTKKPDLNFIPWLVSAQPVRGIMPSSYTQGDQLVTD